MANIALPIVSKLFPELLLRRRKKGRDYKRQLTGQCWEESTEHLLQYPGLSFPPLNILSHPSFPPASKDEIPQVTPSRPACVLSSGFPLLLFPPVCITNYRTLFLLVCDPPKFYWLLPLTRKHIQAPSGSPTTDHTSPSGYWPLFLSPTAKGPNQWSVVESLLTNTTFCPTVTLTLLSKHS